MKPWTLLLTEMISVLAAAGVASSGLGALSDPDPQTFMRKVLLGLIEFGAIGAMFNSVLPETNQEANAADDGTTQVARASAGGVRAPADVAASAAVAGRSPATRLAECDTPSPRVNTD